MADAPSGDLRSTIIAELASGASEAPAEDAPADAVEEAPAEGTPAEEVEAAADDAGPEDDLPDDEPLDEDEPAADDEVELKSDDPKEQKLFDNVRRAEKRMREAAARRDAEFEKRQVEWQSKVDRVAEIDKLTARIKYDPTAVLRALGVSHDDFELIAQSIYAESPALANDPKQKAVAQAKLREREKEEKFSATEKRLADLEAKLEQQKRDAAVQAETQAYIGQINTAAATKFPLVERMLKADPDDTHDALVKTYNTLGQKLNRAPKAAEVVAAFDKAQRARLAKLGIDPDTVAKAKAVAKKPAANSNAPAPAAPAKPTNGAKKLTPQEERAAILAELKAAQSAEA